MRVASLAWVFLVVGSAVPLVWAQTIPPRAEGESASDSPAPAATASAPGRLQQAVRFLAGGAAGLAIHESGHVASALAFSASPGLKRVSFGPFPFFAITHHQLPRRREFIVSSAGFWFQHIGSEAILTSVPDLRHRRAPFLKGILAFDVLTSVGYAATAMAKAGPLERDTRGMAMFSGTKEPLVGAMVLAPAVCDAWRYFKPHSRTAAWSSRAAKAGLMLLVLKARR